MSFVSIMRSLLRPTATRGQSRYPRSRKVAHGQSFRPSLEALEVRTLLSSVPILVTSLADSGSSTLRTAITTADSDLSNSYVIDFNVTGAINLASALPDLTNNVAIRGLGTDNLTVRRDVSGDFSIFTIDAGVNVSISDLSIANGANNFGGGIENSGTLAVTACTLTDNTGLDNAGSIDNNAGTLVVTGCLFEGNATDPSAVGGILTRGGTTTVTNSTLTNSTGSGIGNYGGIVTIVGSDLSGNVGVDGGGIYTSSGTTTVTDCTLTGNSASFGGGYYNDSRGTSTVTDSTFTSNTASTGGGIFNEGNATVANCTLTGNSTTSNAASTGGGGIFNGAVATVTGCTLTGNTAPLGGGYYNDVNGIATITGDTLTDNVATVNAATYGTGGGLYNLGRATVTNSTLTGNSAYNGGGILNAPSAIATITGCNLDSNPASGNGGAVCNGGFVTVTNCTFDNNAATSNDGGGGGIYNYGRATVTNSTLTGNSASFDGGGIDNNTGTVTVTNCTLTGNSGYAGGGGGILNVFGTATVTNCTLTGNSNFTGGGIFMLGGLTTITNCTFTNNSTPGDGGGIFAYGPAMVTNSTFTGNSASGYGGGIDNKDVATIAGCTLTSNTASFGGGITNNGGKVTITGSNFHGNSASVGNGGGVMSSGGTATIASSTLSGNSATFGGGIFIIGGTVMVSGCDLHGNTASQGAGGLYNFSGTTTVTNSTLANNTTTYGGGMFNNAGLLTLTNCTVADNSASVNGGGVFNNAAGTVTANNTIVAANRAPVGPDYSGALSPASSYDLIGDGTAMTGVSNGKQGDQVGTTASLINPLLGSLQLNGGTTATLELLPGSPAIDAGFSALAIDASGIALVTDQRGVTRIINGVVDVGAFESRPFTLTMSGGGQSTTVGSGFLNPLVATVTSAYGDPVWGGVVTFIAPTSGASAIFPASGGSLVTAMIDPVGQAAVAVMANTLVGAYALSGTSRGTSFPAGVSLANTPGTARSFTVSGFPSPTTAGIAHVVNVVARDQYGNVATSYAGLVVINSGDPLATLPSSGLLTGGVGTFNVTLRTAGTQSIMAMDAMTPALTGVQTGITVGPSTAVAFVLTAPATVSQNATFSITVMAVDAYGNLAVGYHGTVRFSSSDGSAGLPDSYTFTATDDGHHAFLGLKMHRKGKETITVFDAAHKTILGSVTVNVT